MPVRITCTSCERKLQIRDDAVGKKIKCPGCGTVFVAKADASAGIKAAPSRPSTTATTRTPPPPRTAPKPQAKRPAPPPPDEDEREDDEELDERPIRQAKRPAPPPLDDDEDERDDDLDERPGRRAVSRRAQPAKASSRMVLWLALGLVVVLGGGVAAYFVLFHDSGTDPIGKGNPANVNPAQQGGNPVAQPGGNPAAPAGTALADLVPGDALAFGSVNGELWNAPALAPLRQQFGKELEANFQKNAGFPLTDLERVSVFSVATFAEANRNKVAPMVVLVQAKKPLDQNTVTAAIRSGDFGKNPNFVVEFVDDRTFVASLAPLVQAFKDKRGKMKASGVLERALQQADTSKGAVVALTIPPEAAQEIQMVAPPQFAALTKAREFFASVDLGDKLVLNGSLTMNDAAAANEAKKTADGFIAMAGFMLMGQGKNDPQMAKAAQQALGDIKLDVKDKEITLAFQTDANLALGLVLPAIQKVRAAAVNVNTSNNLKNIALAWHSYTELNKKPVSQTFNKGLSWRVALLPYLEQPNLYHQFKLDEPWDSPHNIKLLPLMPQIYASPGVDPKAGKTHYQTFVGKKTVNPDPHKGMHFVQMIDGTSNTLLIAEATRPVEWTRPDDIVVTPDDPIMLGIGNSPTAAAAFADGTVRQLPRTFDQKLLRLLIDPTDGTRVQLP